MNINVKGASVCHKKRKDGRYQGYYSDGKNKKYLYGYSIAEVEEKIRQVMKTGIKAKQKYINGAPIDFNEFTMFYFETFRKRRVAPATYRADLNRYNNYLKEPFKRKTLKNITPKDCQSLIDRINDDGKGKTADECFSLLSVIFRTAIKYGILQRNPLDIIYHERHERENGKVLSKDDILRLINGVKGQVIETIIMIALYTGIRPNEYRSVKVEKDFIIAVNSKRKNKKVEYKKIPIMRELRPYLKEDFSIPNYEWIRKAVKEILPEYTLKDIRKTFNSRCIECGINETVRKLWIGHSLGELGKAYTELSDDFMLEESKKFYFFARN